MLLYKVDCLDKVACIRNGDESACSLAPVAVYMLSSISMFMYKIPV